MLFDLKKSIYHKKHFEIRLWMVSMNGVYEWCLWMVSMNGVYGWCLWMVSMDVKSVVCNTFAIHLTT